MIIGGIQKLSLLDYPDTLSAIIFTKGCNFRCPFCYNPMFVLPGWFEARDIEHRDHSQIFESDLFAFLEERQGKLEGVVITGGEPTLHQDLPEFIRKIKQLGYLIKLDTNGTNPEMLSYLLDNDLINYVAMDIKAPHDKYDKVVGVGVNLENIKKSVKIIKESGIGYEFRTTVVAGLLTADDILKIAEEIKGAKKWYLQKFIADADLLNKDLKSTKNYTNSELKLITEKAKEIAGFCQLRGIN
ncbi:MAG: anaerobic ribonucleoside-triphosphate reductase activating protein [Patescibacteria group bacterium]|nr:anaerobic ribonucleoside-triphosphate reductase activating protein [Patescibacteria group bacterium]